VGPSSQAYASGDAAGAIREFLHVVLGDNYEVAVGANLPDGWFERAVADIDTFFQVELPALNEWQFTRDLARRISQPVLSVVGANSDPFFAEGHALLRAWLPQSEAFVLPGATHGLQFMNPSGMAEALAAFLARHSMASVV
jgi:pimeloyl-ACP methyl ester carboxylesterase